MKKRLAILLLGLLLTACKMPLNQAPVTPVNRIISSMPDNNISKLRQEEFDQMSPASESSISTPENPIIHEKGSVCIAILGESVSVKNKQGKDISFNKGDKVFINANIMDVYVVGFTENEDDSASILKTKVSKYSCVVGPKYISVPLN